MFVEWSYIVKELIISDIEAGQRFDKYLVKCLPNAPKSFLYKMLRKKNIVLNGKKADGSEKINSGDSVKIFFSDETYNEFAGKVAVATQGAGSSKSAVRVPKISLDIIYEDEHILVVNKPKGMLSQKAKADDVSLVEYVNDYLKATGKVAADSTFQAGICNRLDRNTSGIVVAGKSIKGLQEMTEAFRERTIEKYYICVVKGHFDKRLKVDGYLYKDEKTNKVTVYGKDDKNIHKDAVYIETEYLPVCRGKDASLLKVHLLTGRTHQIRAHLAYLGHPIAGDTKYGDAGFNKYYSKKYNIGSQMLHAYQLVTDKLNLKTDIPKDFDKVLKGEMLWEPGIPEDLEALR